MTHDTKHGKDTICSSDDTIHSCESETSLTDTIPIVVLFGRGGEDIEALGSAIGCPHSARQPATSLSNCLHAVKQVTARFAEAIGVETITLMGAADLMLSSTDNIVERRVIDGLLNIGTLIHTLCSEVGVDKRETAAATLDNCIDAVRCATHELLALVRSPGTDDGEVSLVDVVPLFAELLPARLRGQDGALQVAMGELKAIEEVVLRHRHAKDVDALRNLSSGVRLDRVVGALLDMSTVTMTNPAGVLSEIEKMLLRTEGTAHSVPVKDLLSAGERLDGVAARVLNTLRRDADKAQAEVKVLTGSVDHWKAEAERWKGLSRQAQRERDDWQAQQAKAESESTKRMLERDVLGDKFADALGIPHRTLFAAGELRYGRPLPDGYKDEAEHPLVVRLAEVLTGRPMGTELPESIVARATAEVLAWMDAPKVPVVRLPVLGRPRDKDETSEVDRWKKAAEAESARANRAEERVTALESEVAGEQLAANSWKSKAEQNAKAASDWESTAKASSARVEILSRTLSDLRVSLRAVLHVHPDADHSDRALISYAKKAADDSAVDGRYFNDGRAEGRADIAAKLRAIIDPEDKRKLDVDGLLAEVKRIGEHVVADAAALRNSYLAGTTGAYEEAARRLHDLLVPNESYGDFCDMVAEVESLMARLEVAKEEIAAAESKAARALDLGRRVGAILGFGDDVKVADLPALAELLEKRWAEMDERLDGLLSAVSWKAAPMRVAAVNLLARLLHESGRQAVKRGENIAQESTFIEWAALPARVKQGRTMTASAMLDSVLIAAAPAPAGSTRLSGACLARQIHKCEKAAIESGHTARQHSTTWIPFDELPEAAMKGRLAQAEFLEMACDLAFFVWDK